jgi:plastocyanin
MPFLILFALGLALPALATDRSSLVRDPRIINVNLNDFQPATITVQKGDVVRWMWQAGSHVIVSGVYQDENAGKIEPIMQFQLNADNKQKDISFGETGTFSFFDLTSPESMHGTITVTEATPVTLVTWGRIKALFEP